MSLVRTASFLAVAALALAACSKAPDKAAPAASGGTAAPTAPQKDQVGPEIPASQMPVIRAGLWETVDRSPGKAPHTDRDCESGKRKPLTMGEACSKLTLHRTLLGGYVFDTQCGTGAMSMTLHVEAHGDFQSHYAVDTTSTLKLPGKPDEVDTSHKEGRYIGPCPAGMEADE